ncbi:GIY-YIG nuclease family protein [Vibrio sp. 10N.286.49.B3]|uniref:GIY-YIG nuclease family protein n=1 Tax=Vibrio sp. 10N.286.49.B3 TaxID=1880855 RepID=UPI000C81EF6C|nr:GIY-YIG nuclease family protein [Vibrio sp. 10N.286.49.B3]
MSSHNLSTITTCSDWYIYFIRTRYDTLYCGITTDLSRRFKQHESGKGAKALRGKGPLSLVWSQKLSNHSEALKCEIAAKKLSKKKKELIVSSQKKIFLSDSQLHL